MRSYKEDKKPVRTEPLKEFVRILNLISIYTSELAVVVAVIQYFDGHLEEGSIEERKQADGLIKKLNKLFSELDKVCASLENGMNLSVAEKQDELDEAKIAISSIRDNMLELWELRNAGRTQKDNDVIHSITLKLFSHIAGAIKRLQKYVNKFNLTSPTKLKFNVKWTALPK